MFLVSHRVTNHLLPCQTAHLYSSLASVVVLQTVTIPNNPCARLAGSCAKRSARQEFPNGHFRVQPDTILRTVHFSCPYVLIQSTSGHSIHSTVPCPAPPATAEAPSDPQGTVSHPFSYPLSQVPVTSLNGGRVRVFDSTTFTVPETTAAAEVVVEPGAMRWGSMFVHV